MSLHVPWIFKQHVPKCVVHEEDTRQTLLKWVLGKVWGALKREELHQDVPTHHFVCIDLALYLAHGQFKFHGFEGSGTFFHGILCSTLVESMELQIQQVHLVYKGTYYKQFLEFPIELRALLPAIVMSIAHACFPCSGFILWSINTRTKIQVLGTTTGILNVRHTLL